jgi:hypothetical protein
MHRFLLVGALVTASCAPAVDNKRLDVLEAQIAELKRSVEKVERVQYVVKASPTTAMCQNTFDTGFPDKTPLTESVAFTVSETTLTTGNAIVIDEVRGTSSKFEVGGAYVVRGHYTLATADEARLALSTRTHTLGNCSRGSTRQATTAHRGTASFELAYRIPFEGDVNLYLANGDTTRGGIIIGHTAP